MLDQEKKDNTSKIDAAKTNNMDKKRIAIITLIIILFLFAFAVLAYFLMRWALNRASDPSLSKWRFIFCLFCAGNRS